MLGLNLILYQNILNNDIKFYQIELVFLMQNIHLQYFLMNHNCLIKAKHIQHNCNKQTNKREKEREREQDEKTQKQSVTNIVTTNSRPVTIKQNKTQQNKTN